jgi:hypothetical protein
MNPQIAQQMAMQQAMARQQQMLGQQALQGAPPPGGPPAFRKGGEVAIEDAEGDSPRAKVSRDRNWGDVGKPAEDLPPEKKAKGGSVKKRHPFGKGAPKKKAKLPPVPMATDEDMDPPDASGIPPMAAAPPAGPAAGPMAGPPPPPPPAGPPPPGMNKGGKCDDKMAKGGGVETKGKTDCETVKMAAGGVAKVRHGFPKTLAKPKKMAKGGTVRGCGAATKGKNFSGIY